MYVCTCLYMYVHVCTCLYMYVFIYTGDWWLEPPGDGWEENQRLGGVYLEGR